MTLLGDVEGTQSTAMTPYSPPPTRTRRGAASVAAAKKRLEFTELIIYSVCSLLVGLFIFFFEGPPADSTNISLLPPRVHMTAHESKTWLRPLVGRWRPPAAGWSLVYITDCTPKP